MEEVAVLGGGSGSWGRLRFMGEVAVRGESKGWGSKNVLFKQTNKTTVQNKEVACFQWLKVPTVQIQCSFKVRASW